MSAVTLSVAIGAGGEPDGAAAHEPRSRETPPEEIGISATPRLPVIGRAPDFTLRDTGGRAVGLAALRNRVVLLSFIYTRCATACPLLTKRLALLQERLVESGLLERRVYLLSVTVDPQRDSAEELDRYASHFAAAAQGWRFLRDEPERLEGVLTAYHEWTRRQDDGEIDHPARIYLIDAGGYIREIYSLSFFDERQALVDILALVGERGPH